MLVLHAIVYASVENSVGTQCSTFCASHHFFKSCNINININIKIRKQ